MKHIFFIVSLITLHASMFSATDAPRVMPARISVDTADTLLSPFKAEAGLALALDLTARYHYLPTWERDSLLGGGDTTRTTLDAARQLNADIVVFSTTSRIGRLVRTEIVLRSGVDYTDAASGVGYALIRYESDSSMIADPAILSSQQRALCVALHDSALYRAADSGLDVRPTRLMTVGGIDFRNDSTLAPLWTLFENRTVVSFDLAATIIDAMKDRDVVTMVDVETRDEMYALAGMLLVENDRPSSFSDLRILRLFEVELVITGSFKRVSDGAILELALCSIGLDGRYTVLATDSTTIAQDSVQALRSAVPSLLNNILKKGLGW